MMRAALAALTLAAAGGAVAVHGQPLSGAVVTATVSQKFDADTNYRLTDPSPGTSYFSDTRLNLGVLAETETQTFSLGVDTGVRALWEADQDFDLTYADPVTARAGYSQEWTGADFNGNLRYTQRSRDVIASPEDSDSLPIVPNDLTTFNGTEQRYDARFGLGLATDAPSSYRFGFEATKFAYSDIPAGSSENAVPRTTINGNALWTLRLNPVLSTGVVAEYLYYQAENSTDEEIRTASLDAGIIYDASDVLNITAGVGYSDRTRTQTILGQRFDTEHNWGPAIRGSVSYDLSYLTIAANARVTTAAPETRVSGDFRLIYDLPRGTLTARAYQTYDGSNSSGDEVLSRGVGLGLTREINNLSRLGFDVALASQIDQDDPAVPDINRLTTSVSYSYDLTRDVSTTLGYRFRARNSTPGDEANSNAVFFSVGRTFSGKP